MNPVRNNEQNMNNKNVPISGHPSSISNGVKSITSTASLLIALFTPTLALAYGDVGTVGTVAITLIDIINGTLVPLLFAVAFIVFLYGVMKTYIFSSGDSAGVETGHKLILWGIIGFVVMISLWGLVNVVSNTFGLAGPFAPPPPTSY
jgi:Ni,Fe-hydrogenase I cytochrome b subunit